jgi:hypothetical protein
MRELLRKQVLARSPRTWLLAWAISLATLPALARAESLPASVRACAIETDADRRLACYDREVARFPAPASKSTAKAAASPQPASTPQAGSAAQAAPTPPPVPAPQAVVKPAAAASSSDTGAPVAGNTPPSDPQHLTARVVSIERLPNEMILHLDNGQVWQEVQGVSGDLSLREGDTVKIDKHFGSYWLSGPHVASMKVRQKG